MLDGYSCYLVVLSMIHSLFSLRCLHFFPPCYIWINSIVFTYIQKQTSSRKSQIGQKFNLAVVLFVFKRRQTEKYSSLSLYIMKLTHQLQEEKERVPEKKKTTHTQNENECRMEEKKIQGELWTCSIIIALSYQLCHSLIHFIGLGNFLYMFRTNSFFLLLRMMTMRDFSLF